MAVAAEQEFQAGVMENRAKVVLAEAEVPKTIACATSLFPLKTFRTRRTT